MAGATATMLSLAITLAGFGIVQCSQHAPARAQLLVLVDTDAPLVGQLGAHPEVSADAAVDALRIDVLGASNAVYATNLFVVADPSSWPVSFGVLPPSDGGADVRLRLRAFRARFARPGSVNGALTLDPIPEVTIDRIVQAALPDAGVGSIEVTLLSDCRGIFPSFAAPSTTCVDATHPQGSPGDAVTLRSGTAPGTRAGTWAPAVEKPCAAAAAAGRVCIPGGFSVLGDYAAVGGANATPDQEPIPLHPVVVAPFFLDREEFTVGRARALVLTGALAASGPRAMTAGDPLGQYCTWLGAGDASNDDLPLNCVPYATALLACQLSQGTLPTEAQWLHAARGRGEGRRYPWGNDEPTCCALSASRDVAYATGPACAGSGLQPVGSHPAAASCDGLGDVSKDGIEDLAGSVAELLLDGFQSYSAACWGRGVLHNPICEVSTEGGPHAAHGGSFSEPLGNALLAPRGYADNGPDFGFRCAYPDSP